MPPKWNWLDTMFLAIVAILVICFINSLCGCSFTIRITDTAPGIQMPGGDEPQSSGKLGEPEKDQSLWL